MKFTVNIFLIDESYFLFSLGYDTVEDDLQGQCMCHNFDYDQISSAASGQLANRF